MQGQQDIRPDLSDRPTGRGREREREVLLYLMYSIPAGRAGDAGLTGHIRAAAIAAAMPGGLTRELERSDRDLQYRASERGDNVYISRLRDDVTRARIAC